MKQDIIISIYSKIIHFCFFLDYISFRPSLYALRNIASVFFFKSFSYTYITSDSSVSRLNIVLAFFLFLYSVILLKPSFSTLAFFKLTAFSFKLWVFYPLIFYFLISFWSFSTFSPKNLDFLSIETLLTSFGSVSLFSNLSTWQFFFIVCTFSPFLFFWPPFFDYFPQALKHLTKASPISHKNTTISCKNSTNQKIM